MPTGSTITIGFANPNGFDEDSDASAAVWYVNHVMGGIQGHPIKLINCHTDATAETDVNCANQFVVAKVPVVFDGYDFTMNAEYPILKPAHIPIVGQVAGGTAQSADPDSYYFGPADLAFASAPFEILKQQTQIRSIDLTGANMPGNSTYVNEGLKPAAAKYGIKLDDYLFPDTNTNWLAVAQTLKASHDDMVGTIGGISEGDCVTLLQDLRSIGWTKPVFLGGCLDYITELPASATNGTMTYTAIWQPQVTSYAPAIIQQNTAKFEAAAKAAGVTANPAQQPVLAFSTIVTIAEIMQTAKDPTDPVSVTAAIKATNNFQVFLGPKITCNGKQWPGQNTCTDGFLMVQAQGGKFKPMTAFTPVSP